MIIIDEAISFTRDDWNNGKARKAIAWLKEHGGTYNPLTKNWKLRDTNTLKKFTEHFSDNSKKKISKKAKAKLPPFSDDAPFFIDPNDYNIQELMMLKQKTKEIELFLEILHEDGAKESVIKRTVALLVNLDDLYQKIIKDKK